MSVEEQVDILLQNNNDERITKKHFKFNKCNFLIGFGSMVVTALLMTILVIPVSRELISETFFGAGEETAVSLGDDNNGSAYHYWYAPPNSFGIQETKTVNWSYFKQLFLAHTDWMLEYKRYESSEWTDGNQYMTINRTWNDTGFWKFNLIFDVPVDVYSARFTFGCDLPVLQYVERSGYEVWVNYSANATENYSVMFNWSDLASIPNLVISKGVQNDMFWFRFRRDNILAGHYEFDPTFGHTGTEVSTRVITDELIGTYATPASSGTCDNITVWLALKDIGDQVKCTLYTTNGVYIDETLERADLSGAGSWEIFVFDAPKPEVTSGNEYLLLVTSDDQIYGYYGSETGFRMYYLDSQDYDSGLPNPLDWGGTNVSNYACSIYCSYTVSGANWQVINNTINGSLFNQSQISVISNTINGSLWNVSAMSVFNNTINGSIYNTSQVSVINNTINGSIYNSSALSVISNTINGSLWNISAFSVFSSGINGSIYNLSLYTSVNSTINGSIYNTSQVSVISNTINGSLWNVSQVTLFSDTINGTIYNGSQFSVFNSTINGSIYNTSQYSILFNNINGSLWNVSAYVTFSDTINGSIYNSSPYTIIQSNINGSLYNVTPPALDITLEYPENESNILIVQPTLYFNLTSPTGSLMNYTIYIGSSSGNCNTWLCNFSNVCNGTYRNDSQYYSAVNYTTYYWMVSATDGSDSINETYHFKLYVEREVMTPGFEMLICIISIFMCLFIIKRWKKDV